MDFPYEIELEARLKRVILATSTLQCNFQRLLKQQSAVIYCNLAAISLLMKYCQKMRVAFKRRSFAYQDLRKSADLYYIVSHVGFSRVSRLAQRARS